MAYDLIPRIIELSTADSWDLAKKEWELEHIELKPNSTCLCSKHPIVEVCHMTNTSNNNTASVGNCCIKKFFEDTSKTKMFKAISKKKINFALIEYSYERNYINQWEFDFMTKLWRKRTLSPKQEIIFEKIKNRILEKVIHGKS